MHEKERRRMWQHTSSASNTGTPWSLNMLLTVLLPMPVEQAMVSRKT